MSGFNASELNRIHTQGANFAIYPRFEGTIEALEQAQPALDGCWRGTPEYRARLDYLRAVGTQAIVSVKQSMHHGAANLRGQTGHKVKSFLGWDDEEEDYVGVTGRQPQGAYRYQLSDGIRRAGGGRFGGSWFDKARWKAAAGIVAKGGSCDLFSCCVLMWCVMNARCRVALVEKTGFDHVWVVLNLGNITVIVDAWVPEPALSFPSECAYWQSPEDVCTFHYVDVVGPNDTIMDEPLSEANALRFGQKEASQKHKGQTVAALGIQEMSARTFRTNIKSGATTQLGVAGAIEYIRPGPHESLQGLSINPIRPMEAFDCRICGRHVFGSSRSRICSAHRGRGAWMTYRPRG